MSLPKFNISQRGFSALLDVVAFLLIGFVAVQQGVFHLSDLNTKTLLSFWLPLSGVAYGLKTWFDYLDAKVADGSLKAGDILGLFNMPTFFVWLVASWSGIYTIFGGAAFPSDVQTMIVDAMLLIENLLIRSFTNRPATVTISKAQYVIRKEGVKAYPPAA